MTTATSEVAASRIEQTDENVREILRNATAPLTVLEVNEEMGRAESSAADTRQILTRIGALNRYMRSNRSGRQPKVYALDEATLTMTLPEEENGAEMARPAKKTTSTAKRTARQAPAKRTTAKRSPGKPRASASTSTPHAARTTAPAAPEGTFTVTPYQMQGGEPVLADEQGHLYVAKPLEMPEGMRQRV